MATAAERQQQHAIARREFARFEELLDTFRVRPVAAPTATVPERRSPAAPKRPSKPSSRPYAEQLLSGIPWWQFALRRAAREESERQADRMHQHLLDNFGSLEREHAAELERTRRETEAEQRLLEVARKRLADGDPAAVELAVRHALRALPFTAALAGLNGSVASIAVVLPPAELGVPDREPAFTPTGKPTSRKLNQGARNDLFCELVCGAALAAARRSIAAAFALTDARVIVLVDEADRSPAVAHCAVRRENCKSWRSDTDVVEAFYEADGWVEQAGRTRAVQPLDRDAERDLDPALRALIGGFAEAA